MSQELNYPIKYAVLELKERGDINVGYKDITQGFIVSKCYVISSNILYQPDGTKKITHSVVFPFENISLFKFSLKNGKKNIGREAIPHYDSNNKIQLTRTVEEIYDTYDEAKKESSIKNLSFYEKNLNLGQEKVKNNIDICIEFEKEVANATSNMDVIDEKTSSGHNSFVKVLTPIKKEV